MTSTVTIIVLAVFLVVMVVKYYIVTNESANKIDSLHRKIRELEHGAKDKITDRGGQVWQRVE